MSDDFFGPASDGAVTTRPVLAPQMVRAGGAPTFFAPCSDEDTDDGTQVSAEWLNLIVTNLDAVRAAAGIGAGDEPPGSAGVLLASILELIATAIAGMDLSAYLAKAGGTLTGGGHISDPIDPEAADHLVRLGYLNSRLGGLGGGGGVTLPANAAGWLHNDGAGGLGWTTPPGSYTYGGLGTTIVKSSLNSVAGVSLDSTTTLVVGGISGTYKLAYIQRVQWFGDDVSLLNYVLVYVRVL